jgi:hypothetical protein
MTLTQTRTPGLLSTLTPGELAAADPRYPKWATMCQLRRLGLPVLDGILIVPGQDRQALDAAITALATATGQDHVMIRSDGGAEPAATTRAATRSRSPAPLPRRPGCWKPDARSS